MAYWEKNQCNISLALCSERYTEVVTPLLVFAQQQLQERMQFRSDSKSPQLDSKPITFVGDTVNKVRMFCIHSLNTSKTLMKYSIRFYWNCVVKMLSVSTGFTFISVTTNS